MIFGEEKKSKYRDFGKITDNDEKGDNSKEIDEKENNSDDKEETYTNDRSPSSSTRRDLDDSEN